MAQIQQQSESGCERIRLGLTRLSGLNVHHVARICYYSCRLAHRFFGPRRIDESPVEFAARLEAMDKQYLHLLEEQFQLKEYGKLSLIEQNHMIAEDRKWWLKRLEREAEERRKQEERAAGKNQTLPNFPSGPQ